jgi:hypothetical protein
MWLELNILLQNNVSKQLDNRVTERREAQCKITNKAKVSRRQNPCWQVKNLGFFCSLLLIQQLAFMST